MIFKPYEYQEAIVDFALKNERCAIWADMGMGKTSACLMILDILSLLEDYRCLVIAPLRVARDVWPVECDKWDNFKHLNIVPITGTPDERKAAIRQRTNVHSINYENLSWLEKVVGKKWPWDIIISDESTRLKSFRLRQGGDRARSLAKFAWTKARRFIELTGTPTPNGLIDLWGQMWFLDKGERLGRTYTSYANKYFRLKNKHSRFSGLECMPFCDDIIHNKVKDITLRIDAKDYFDLKEPVVREILVYLPDSCITQYKKLKKEMFLQLKTVEINAKNAAAVSTKCRQYANGALYDEEKNWHEVHKEKLFALESIINEWSGENILVAYEFKSDLIRLKKHFPKGRELKDSKAIKQWNKGKIPLLFTHPGSAGHGLNLQDGGRIIVYFGQTWNLEYRQQILERIGPMRQHQSGHDRLVYIYNIVTKNTVDEIVMQSVATKTDVQDLLLNSAKG